MLGEAFDMCIACSPKVIESFQQSEEKQFEFLLNTCNIPGFLEDLTGLSSKLKEFKFDDIDDFIDFDEEEEMKEEL